MREHFDAAIIGAGQAGPTLAATLADQGQTVALIEGNLLGGSCVNYGCTPTKTLRKSARVAHLMRRAGEFGVRVGTVEVDFAAAMARMRERVEQSRIGLESWLEGLDGVEVIRGWGAFEGTEQGRFQLAAGARRLSADKVYLNTGTRASVPPIEGADAVPYLDNVSLLELTERPEHLIVVGGSYIGLEMGQIFQRLGSDVTIVNAAARLAEREDEDVSQIIQEVLEREGVRVLNSAAIARVGRDADGVALDLEDGMRVAGSHLLFATGRTPNSDRLQLEKVGVDCDKRGFVQTDGHLRTSVSGIWAMGDVNGRGAFTHTSYHDHEIVVAHAVRDVGPLHQWRGADARPTTYAMYTDPPLGRVGMNLEEARKAAAGGRNILTASMPMSGVGRAKEEGETDGVIRIIADGDSERILGATVLGFAGDEVIAVLSNFMATRSSYRILQQALPIHPTVAELLPSVVGSLETLTTE